MFFAILILAIGIYFYYNAKTSKALSSESLEVENLPPEPQKLSIDEEIDMWVKKNEIIKDDLGKDASGIKPSISEENLHILSVCGNCFSVFSLMENSLSCPCCKSEDVIFSNKGKLFSGKWNEQINDWELSSDSAHPIMLIGKPKV